MSELTKRLREVAGKYDEYDLHGDIELEVADRIDALEEVLREIINLPPRASADHQWALIDKASALLEEK